MFEVGFQELFLLGVIALLVVGPERLPALARTVGLWVGKAQRLVSQVRADVERELHAEELRRTMREDSGVDAIAEVRKEMEGLAGGFSQPAFETPPPEAAKEAPPEPEPGPEPETPAEVEAVPAPEPEPEPPAELVPELQLEPPAGAAPELELEPKRPAEAAPDGGAGGANGVDGKSDQADGTAPSSAPPAGDRDDRAAAS